jgi:hypothetical protein
MLYSTLLLSLANIQPAPADASLLAAVPGDAHTLAHCRDFAALRARAERNDWYRLLGSSHGEPVLIDLGHEFHQQTHSDMDGLLEMASMVQGEVVAFDTGSVAGVIIDPPADRETLAGLMRGWLPGGEAAARRTLEVKGATVELVAWPEEIDGWTGRAGHFAALVDHPSALALYSGDDSAAVMAALTQGIEGLGHHSLGQIDA